ncbi:hypothetical protein [Clostridium sp. OS1-26]|uniref:hypothetical protein n=1 Tax=Clostridium sp. OS1-26 TaxID=3070681 RepID=UPI0027DEDE5C|nr:hypothetical protein [Clostridium sp. OS1-26]WML33794.1 hypothetical protein RCG18_21030 [Clostridium sp. OS1-26]
MKSKKLLSSLMALSIIATSSVALGTGVQAAPAKTNNVATSDTKMTTSSSNSTSISTSSVARIEFISTVLTKTGTNTATFQYRLLDKNGVDITKAIPASEILAVASVSSSIVLDPLTGTGTITFNNASSTVDVVTITLVDSINGIAGIIKYPSLNLETPGASES